MKFLFCLLFTLFALPVAAHEVSHLHIHPDESSWMPLYLSMGAIALIAVIWKARS